MWERWDPAPWDGGVADPQNTSPLSVCYHVKFGSSALKGVCINRREPPKFGTAEALPLAPDPLEIRSSTHMLFCRIWSFYYKGKAKS